MDKASNVSFIPGGARASNHKVSLSQGSEKLVAVLGLALLEPLQSKIKVAYRSPKLTQKPRVCFKSQEWTQELGSGSSSWELL